MPSKMKASVALILAFIISRWHRHVSSVLVAFLLIAATPISAFAKGPEGWKVFTDSDEKIQFLSIGLPKKQQVNNPDITRIIWHLGSLRMAPMDVDAMRLIKEALQF
ncbi:MAG: hypothetical protein IPN91_13815 [Holophagaceae bacterium]|uniref:Uncharacterized protein n=1 Tax=Candidatus Geothrix odensensis TaxID=2954440 RepID=A0A936F3X6_9BACT|nr:hypothetical protein [Candidatus Geothrix odensensis]